MPVSISLCSILGSKARKNLPLYIHDDLFYLFVSGPDILFGLLSFPFLHPFRFEVGESIFQDAAQPIEVFGRTAGAKRDAKSSLHFLILGMTQKIDQRLKVFF